MSTYVVLLRGVMPSGKNKVPMAQLREVLSDAGFDNVRTYIQSGNALLDSSLLHDEIESAVHKLIKEKIGPDLAVMARTGEQLQKVLDNNPYQQRHATSRMFFVLFSEPPPSRKVGGLLGQDYGEEELAITEDAAYLLIPGTYGRGRLSSNFLERKLGVAATMRNFNTLSRLVEMSRPSEGS
ncbi:DUF1697 domain-containing protein [Deinococcus aluminii]|uniref:DUF1697 domain-containing protein n=1 Tax=Deinococcus aluminii TaxID=1656885 RepID=UPI0031E6B16A